MSAYAELAVSTNFSFLRGASHGEELVARAKELGLAGLGVADRNSVAGVVRAHQAAKDAGLTFAPGARLVFADGTPDILAYPQDRAAWGRLVRLLTLGKRRAGKGECLLQRDDLFAHIAGLNLDRDARSMRKSHRPSDGPSCETAAMRPPQDEVLKSTKPDPELSTGCADPCERNGKSLPGLGEGGPRPWPRAGWGGAAPNLPRRQWVSPGCDPTRPALRAGHPPRSRGGFRPIPAKTWSPCCAISAEAASGAVWLGAGMLYRGDDARRLARLAAIAGEAGVPLIAVGDVLYHAPERRPLQDVMTCIREHLMLAAAGRRLEANAERHLKAPDEMARLFRTARGRCADIAVSRPLPVFARRIALRISRRNPRRLCHAPGGAGRLYGGRAPARAIRDGIPAKVRAALDHEFALIAELQYAPYFLTVHDIVRYARSQGILCQGRGSAANSAICYCLGITEVDPARADLLFERFVSAERREPPDIDVDFEHERREDVIQYIYGRYGRHRAGLAATVICYRARSAIREVGKVFGLSDDTVGALAGMLWGWSTSGVGEGCAPGRARSGRSAAARVLALARELIGFPRHLSQHVGGFVITRGRLDEVVPIENAAMEDRTCVEWDKDDLDALGILKIDVLALGMLTCLRRGFDLLNRHYGITPSSPSPRLRGEGRSEGQPQARTRGEVPSGGAGAGARLLPAPPPPLGESRDGEISRVEPVETSVLPPFSGEGGRARRIRPSAGPMTGSARPGGEQPPYHGEDPTPALPEDGEGEGAPFSLAAIPPEESAVYRMLSRADSIGVFQVESRAQMSMLPRLKPKTFYDLVIEVAIVRPGPIQGDMVHPYLRRRQGIEKVQYPSPVAGLRRCRRVGKSAWQDARGAAVPGAGDAHRHRGGRLHPRRGRSVAPRHGDVPPGRHHKVFPRQADEGMAGRGYPRDFAERCFRQIEGFGEYGFPESHAASFALLVYASAWMKCRYPDVFTAALLNSQPMGFYAPAQIVRDAQEHGVAVLPVDVNYSCWDNSLEARDDTLEARPLSLRLGEGGRAKRGQVGLAIAPGPATPPGAQARATLPEAGGGMGVPPRRNPPSPLPRGERWGSRHGAIRVRGSSRESYISRRPPHPEWPLPRPFRPLP